MGFGPNLGRPGNIRCHSALYLFKTRPLRTLSFILACFLSQLSMGQEDFLAKQYFQDGEFDKAVIFYEKLVETNPRRTDYVEGLVACYQQLERYGEAEALLLEKLSEPSAFPTFFIELGYTYTLWGQPDKAGEPYEKAIQKINENPNLGFSVGHRFQKYALLDHALRAYARAMELRPELNYTVQIARIYGEQGDIESMFRSYLDLIWEGKVSRSNVLREINDFITADPTSKNNLLLRQLLLKNAQQNPDILWNELLSWLFVQQKQYGSAFNQEKAIEKRMEGGSMDRLGSLGDLALEGGDPDTAREVFQYMVDRSADPRTRLDAQLQLIDMELKGEVDGRSLDRVQGIFEELVAQYGIQGQTLQLQMAYANFLCFHRELPQPAIDMLKKSLEGPMPKVVEAHIKLALGDILVYGQRFNEALILFTQVQQAMKNDVLGQNARFKVAQTSFYKGDFDWALGQLKVLRGSTSQLMANDAMQLSLLISDNSLEDSTRTALKKYARADLLAYQNKDAEAIALLEDILQNHKGESIEDEALLRQAQLWTDRKDYESAEFNYRKILEFHPYGILADDAHFALGKLYRDFLGQPERAKDHFEKIVLEHPDSYHFPQARTDFRRLRGDAIN